MSRGSEKISDDFEVVVYSVDGNELPAEPAAFPKRAQLRARGVARWLRHVPDWMSTTWWYRVWAVVVLASTLGVVYATLRGVADSHSDRASRIGASVGAGGLWLALIATVIALFTFGQGRRRPKLWVDAWREDGPTDVLELELGDESNRGQAFEGKLRLTVINKGAGAARDVVVHADLFHFYGLDVQGLDGPTNVGGWSLVEDRGDGLCSLRWEGGADHVVHADGDWRQLPPVTLAGLVRLETNRPWVEVRVVTEGDRSTWSLPVLIGAERFEPPQGRRFRPVGAPSTADSSGQ